jgi:hypothetical protein
MRLNEIVTSEGYIRYLVLDDDGELIIPIARYLKHLDLRGYARNTLRSYGTCLQLFFEYLAQKGLGVQGLTVDDMAGFVHWLKMPSGHLNVLPHQPVQQVRSN